MATIQLGIGLSTHRDPAYAASEAVQQAKINLGQANISLAMAFGSSELSCPSLLKSIAVSLPEVPLIGCSTAAIIHNRQILKHGLMLLLLDFPGEVYFNTACVQDIKTKGGLKAGEELGEKLLYGFQGVRRDLSITFSDGLMEDGSNLITGLQEKLGLSFPLAGASASDDLRFLKTYVYFNQQLLSDACAGVLWGGKLNFGLGVKHGWKPLGKPRSVTKSKGNIVYEIDHAPAAKVYEEYLAYDLAKLKQERKRISIFYPIGIYIAGEEEYLLRNILSIEDNGVLIFQGNVPENSKIRLMIGTKESCLTATSQAASEAKKGLSGRTCNFVLVFDSISRYILLGRDAYKEQEIIKREFGENTPVAGLYTYGEQAPLRSINYLGRPYFHNQTVTVLAIGA